MKKKILIMLCVCAICSSFVACGDKTDTEKTTAESTVSSEVTSESTAETNKTDDEKSAETTSEETKTGEFTAVDNAEDIIKSVVENVKDNKNCTATAEMSMNANIVMSANGEKEEQKMSEKMTAEMWSNDTGMHVITNNTASEDGGPEQTTKEEKYVIYSTNKQYVHSDDYGEYWYEQDFKDDSVILNTNSIFGDTDQFKNAKVETDGNTYIISMDLSNVENFTSAISEEMDGTTISGNLLITVDKNFYPTSIEMTNVEIDTSSLEEMIMSFAAMGAEEEAPEGETVPDMKVDMDIDFDFKINFTGWNGTADKDVTPPDDVITNSVPTGSGPEDGIITDDVEESTASTESTESTTN